MPNWIDNNITIYGDEQKLNEIIDFVKSKENVFDFDKIVPMPPHSETFFRDGSFGAEEEKKYSKNNWYDWSIENWGTKWNSCDSSLSGKDKGEIRYFFQTAWAPALPVLKALAEKFQVKVQCVFMEEFIGCNCGKTVYNESGEAIEEEYYRDDGFDFLAREYGEEFLVDCGYVRKDGEWKYEDFE